MFVSREHLKRLEERVAALEVEARMGIEVKNRDPSYGFVPLRSVIWGLLDYLKVEPVGEAHYEQQAYTSVAMVKKDAE